MHANIGLFQLYVGEVIAKTNWAMEEVGDLDIEPYHKIWNLF